MNEVVMKQSPAKKVAFMGLLFALALVFSYLESLIPAVAGMPPGIKLGLSNVVTMYCLFFLGAPSAITLVLLKSGFTFLIRGYVAGLLSLSGGVLSVAVMLALSIASKKRLSVGFESVAGAVSHNIGQLILARLLIGSDFMFYYLPVLIISGIIMGIITALVFRTISPYLEKMKRS